MQNAAIAETSTAKYHYPQDVSILIVDDEASIRKSLQGIFKDEGFHAMVAEDGTMALHLLRSIKPSVVLLDIWMPGIDGLEVLSKMLQLNPEMPVIMMSGHATIATAVKATHLGASDFIEKPLDMNFTIEAVRRALERANVQEQAQDAAALVPSVEETALLERSWDKEALNRLAFSLQAWKGRAIPQRTLSQSAVLYGQGLHSGRKSGLILEPLPPGSGIHFMSVSESKPVPAHLDFVDSTGFATTLRLKSTQAGTIEHIMSALHAYGVSNLLIKCNGEVPVMDGSAREFCALFDQVGVVEQDGEWFEIEVKHPVQVGNEREFIKIEPHDSFCIDYTLDYPEPVGRQHLVFTLDSIDSYKKWIAPARTFGFVKDIGALQKQGLALGGRFDNFVLIGAEGAINGEMRFPEEPVRHKILDAIGDLYLLGRTLRGKVTAQMTGHSDNIALLKALKTEMLKEA